MRTNQLFLAPAVLMACATSLSAAVHPLAPGGADDTQMIQSTLDICAVEANCVVELGPGVFRTRQIVVKDFHGTIRGAGRDNTFVEPAGKLTVPESPDWSRDPGEANRWPVLWTFINGDISISGIGFRVRDESPVTPYKNLPGNPGPNPATHLLALLLITGSRADSNIDQCGFEGAKGNFPDLNWPATYNLHYGLVQQSGQDGWLEGNHTVTSNRFANMTDGYTSYQLRNGRVVVGGGPGKSNTFDQACYAIEMFDYDNVMIEISNNYFQACPGFGALGVWLEQEPGASKSDWVSTVLISNNSFRWFDGFAISVADYVKDGSGRKMDFLITGNVIESTQNAGGISILARNVALPANTWSSVNAVISQNRVSGSASRRAFNITGALRTALIDNDVSQYKTTLPAAYFLSNSFNTVIVGTSGSVDVGGTGADTHTFVGVKKN